MRRDLLQTAAEFYETFAREHADDPVLKAELGDANLRLAEITGEIESGGRAAEFARLARSIYEELGRLPGAGAASSWGLAQASSVLGWLNFQTNQMDQADRMYREARLAAERLLTELPRDARPRRKLGEICGSHGIVLQALGRMGEAEEAFLQGRAILEALVRERPRTLTGETSWRTWR